MTLGLEAVENNLVFAKDGETSGAKVFTTNIAEAITAMKGSAKAASDALIELKKLSEGETIVNCEKLIAQINEMIVNAEDLQEQAVSAVQTATAREGRDVLRGIARCLKEIQDHKKEFSNSVSEIGKVLEEANQILAAEHLIVPRSMEKIKTALRKVNGFDGQMDDILSDAEQIKKDAESDKQHAAVYLKQITDLVKKADGLSIALTGAKKDAHKALKTIKRMENLPNTAGEFFGMVATVPVKQYRRYNWSTKKFRAIFGSAMLLSFLVGAINWSIAFRDLTQSLASGITAGVVWFFLVSMIDRIFVVSMDKQAAKRLAKDRSDWTVLDKIKDFLFGGEIVFMAIRVVVIFYSSLIVSEVITANLYDKEIKQELIVMKAETLEAINQKSTTDIAFLNKEKKADMEEVDKVRGKYNLALAPLKTAIDQQSVITNQAHQEYIDELNGDPRTHHSYGNGSVAKAKFSVWQQQEQKLSGMNDQFEKAKSSIPEYAALKTAEANAEADIKRVDELIAKNVDAKNKQIAVVQKTSSDGLDQRMTALKRVSKNSPWPGRFMIMLFIIEAIPLIGKILIGKDEHVEEMKSANEASEENLKVIDLTRRAKNADLMGTQRALIVDLKKTEYEDNEKLLELQSAYENKLLASVVGHNNLPKRIAELENKRGMMQEFISRKRAIDSMLNELEPASNKSKKKTA